MAKQQGKNRVQLLGTVIAARLQEDETEKCRVLAMRIRCNELQNGERLYVDVPAVLFGTARAEGLFGSALVREGATVLVEGRYAKGKNGYVRISDFVPLGASDPDMLGRNTVTLLGNVAGLPKVIRDGTVSMHVYLRCIERVREEQEGGGVRWRDVPTDVPILFAGDADVESVQGIVEGSRLLVEGRVTTSGPKAFVHAMMGRLFDGLVDPGEIEAFEG